jgi:hypothetical protein
MCYESVKQGLLYISEYLFSFISRDQQVHVWQIKKFRKKTLQRMANKFIRLHMRARAHLLCLEKHDPYINPLSVKVKLGLLKSQTYTKQHI